MLLSLVCLFLLLQKSQKSLLWLFSLSLATAISLSYSVLPVASALFFYLLLKQRTLFKKLLLPFFISLFLLNLPTIFFELRHHFILTQTLLERRLTSQDGLSLAQSFKDLLFHSFNLSSLLSSYLFLLLIIFKSPKPYPLLILLSFLAFLIFPIKPQAHYIFAFTSLVFFALASLKPIFKFPLLALLLFFYLQPSQLNAYFSPAPRSYQEMLSCYQKFCQTVSDPIFVSVNSSYHPYHHGPEHRYLLKKAGCTVIDQETNPTAAHLMVVIADGGDYQHGKTQFFELESFGPSQQISQTNCQDNLKIYLLQR